MAIIGLTGGIGSGKTTVSDMFKAFGITIVDTDLIAREVVLPGTEGLKHIVAHFGEDILTKAQTDLEHDTSAARTLDRKKLRECVFKDPNERIWLESLLHPLIHTATESALEESSSAYTILSSPLLLETQDKHRVDRVVVVDVPLVVQLARAMTRDNADETQIKAIIAAQLPREQRLAKAHDIVDNSQSLNHTQQQVAELHQRYLTLVNESA